MAARRAYVMRARAEEVERTREHILQAGLELTEERATYAVSLSDVAERAGVTVRTILRHFGSRDGLFDALLEQVKELVREERAAPVGDLKAAVHIIVGHYEKRGDRVLRMLEEEPLNRWAAQQVPVGRRMHREWVRAVFGPYLHPDGDGKTPSAGERKLLEDLLVVATDVYTWKLLRRDMGLSRVRTEEHMQTMIHRLVERGD